jgi:hypothetical protein
MNWARPKLKIGSFDLTSCFCSIFSIARCFLLAIARGPARTKKRVFPVNLSISVQPCLTFLPVPLASSIFPASYPPGLLPTAYCILSSNVPPFCTPTTPYCTATTPFCTAATPSNAATTPGFRPGDHYSKHCAPCTVHCPLLQGCQGKDEKYKNSSFPWLRCGLA